MNGRVKRITSSVVLEDLRRVNITTLALALSEIGLFEPYFSPLVFGLFVICLQARAQHQNVVSHTRWSWRMKGRGAFMSQRRVFVAHAGKQLRKKMTMDFKNSKDHLSEKIQGIGRDNRQWLLSLRWKCKPQNSYPHSRLRPEQ
jgi:hypothetical protein